MLPDSEHRSEPRGAGGPTGVQNSSNSGPPGTSSRGEEPRRRPPRGAYVGTPHRGDSGAPVSRVVYGHLGSHGRVASSADSNGSGARTTRPRSTTSNADENPVTPRPRRSRYRGPHSATPPGSPGRGPRRARSSPSGTRTHHGPRRGRRSPSPPPCGTRDPGSRVGSGRGGSSSRRPPSPRDLDGLVSPVPISSEKGTTRSPFVRGLWW